MIASGNRRIKESRGRGSEGATTVRAATGIVCCLGLSLLLATLARAELVCSLGADVYYDSKSDGNASPDALRIAREVANVICGGTCNIALFRNPTAGNLLTVTAQDGSAKIVYNPQFLKSIDSSIGNGAIFGLFAHEVGHVVDRRLNVTWMPGSWDHELRADAWAGCAIARAALPDDRKTAALRAMLRYPPIGHQARDLRVPALELGYHSCGGAGTLPSLEKDQ